MCLRKRLFLMSLVLEPPPYRQLFARMTPSGVVVVDEYECP